MGLKSNNYYYSSIKHRQSQLLQKTPQEPLAAEFFFWCTNDAKNFLSKERPLDTSCKKIFCETGTTGVPDTSSTCCSQQKNLIISHCCTPTVCSGKFVQFYEIVDLLHCMLVSGEKTKVIERKGSWSTNQRPSAAAEDTCVYYNLFGNLVKILSKNTNSIDTDIDTEDDYD